MRVAALLVGLAGCAQLFGIDNTTGSNVDAPGPGAHVSFRRASIGTTTLVAPLDLSTTNDKVTFLVPDASDPSGYQHVPGAVEALGVWHADIAVKPLVDFTIFGGRHLWALSSSDLHVETAQLEHPNADMASPTAMLNMNVNVPATTASDGFQLEAIGAWSYFNLAAEAAGTTTLTDTLAYSMFAPMGAQKVARIVPADTVVLLRHDTATNDLTGVFQTSFDQADTNTLTGTLAVVTPDRTLDVNINPGALATRYTAVRPAVSGLGMNWALVAAPGYTRGIVAGPGLAAAGVAVADTKITHTYGNPFTSLGWNELLYYTTAESRTFMPASGPAIALYAGLYSVTEPSANLTLDLPAGLPESISVNDVPVTSDGMQIDVDAQKLAHVTFVADHPTNAVYEAVLSKVTATGLAFVIDALSNDAGGLWLPADAFETGQQYTIEVVCIQGGYPNAATGDLETTMLPFHLGYNYSGVFTANKP
jgi:hypothetical protein